MAPEHMFVSATGAVNGPVGFAVFLLSHCPSVRSCARQLEVVREGYCDFLGEPGRVGEGVGGGKGYAVICYLPQAFDATL